MSVEIASAYVSLVPSFKGGAAAIVRELGGPSEKAGKDSGSRFGSSFMDFAKKGMLAGAAALGAGFIDALNVDAANDKLAAQLGLTQKESERIGGVAGRLYADAYGDSMGNVNDAIRGVIANIDGMRGASSASLEDVAARALDLSAAFDEDLGAATRAVGVIMRTGLADSAEEAFDVLTRGYQAGVNGSGDLLDTFTEYPALFQRLGLDAETAMGLLSQGLASGARNSDLVADALKEFQIRATDASTLSAEGFRILGLNAEEMTRKIASGGAGAKEGLDQVLDALRNTEDPVQRNAAAVALFGTQAEDLGAALFSIDPSSAVDSLGQVAGASDRLGETLNSNAKTNLVSFARQVRTVLVELIGGKVLPILQQAYDYVAKNFGPAISALGSTIANTLAPALAAVGSFLITKVVPAMQALARWLKENQAWLKPIAVGVLTVVAAYKAWTLATKAWTAATALATAAQKLMDKVMKATTIGKVILLLGGLVAALTYAWKNSETFRKIVTAVWTAIKNVTSAVATFIRVQVIDKLVAGFRMFWTFMGAVKDGVGSLFSSLGRSLAAIANAVRVNVIDKLVAGFRAFWTFMGAVKDGVASAFSAMGRALGTAVGWIRENVIQPLGRVFQSLWDKAKQVKDGVVIAFGRIGEGIMVAFSKIGDIIKAPINVVIRLLNGGIIGPINGILGKFSDSLSIPSIPQLNKGGVVPGGGPDRDSVLTHLTPGEGVITRRRLRELARGMGVSPAQAIRDLNAGKIDPSVLASLGSGRGFGGLGDALGDIVDAIQGSGDPMSALFNGLAEAGSSSVKALLSKVMDAAIASFNKLPGTLIPFGMVKSMLPKIKEAILGWGEKQDNGLSNIFGVTPQDVISGDFLSGGSWNKPLKFGYSIGVPIGGYPGHTGQDLPAPTGTPVFAAAAGRAAVQYLTTSYGKNIKLQHGNGWYTRYAHLSNILVGANDLIRKGQIIGQVGSTGNSTGPHLHFEMNRNGSFVDPRRMIKFDTGMGVLPTGHSLVYNGTGGPEPLIDPRRHGSQSGIQINNYGTPRDLVHNVVFALSARSNVSQFVGV